MVNNKITTITCHCFFSPCVFYQWAISKKAIFDGATMDKLTYAVLKGSNANLFFLMHIDKKSTICYFKINKHNVRYVFTNKL